MAKKKPKRVVRKPPLKVQRDAKRERARQLVEKALAAGRYVIAIAYVEGDTLHSGLESFSFPNEDVRTFGNFVLGKSDEGSVAGGKD